MYRTLAVLTATLALASAAHAQEQMTVTIIGKSPRIVRADVYRAALTVCRNIDDGLLPDNLDACVSASYDDAMHQLVQLRRYRSAALTTQTAP